MSSWHSPGGGKIGGGSDADRCEILGLRNAGSTSGGDVVTDVSGNDREGGSGIYAAS